MFRSVSIIGLGFIGLPLAMSFCERGLSVVGIDTDMDKVENLRQGRTDVMESHEGLPLTHFLAKHLSAKRFQVSNRVAVAAWESDAYIVTVGVPVSPKGDLNETPLISAMERLGAVIKPNDLILIRSTVAPGMVEQKLVPVLEQASHMIAGTDFHVAYAAERVAEGRAMLEFQTLDIVVGGLTPKCCTVAASLLSQLTTGRIHTTDLRTAQAVKVVENAQRDVNIALAQELAIFAKQLGIDVYELIRLANTHPRVRLLEPGIGVGGYCIPNAYHYLRHGMKDVKPLRILPESRQINAATPSRIVDELEHKLRKAGKWLNESIIAVLGLGMKDNSNDVRQSPAIDICNLLQTRGAVVRAYDPLVPQQFPFQTKSFRQAVFGADGLIIGAWHDVFDQIDFAHDLTVCDLKGAIIDLKGRLNCEVESISKPDNETPEVPVSAS